MVSLLPSMLIFVHYLYVILSLCSVSSEIVYLIISYWFSFRFPQDSGQLKSNKVLLDAPCSGLGVLSKVIVLNMFTHCHCFCKIIQCIPLFLFVNLLLFLGFWRERTCVGTRIWRIWNNWRNYRMSSWMQHPSKCQKFSLMYLCLCALFLVQWIYWVKW